ncbi:MAG: Trk system potassium transporter TrkA [Clostridia bacterium]|nr:Trk system potassium transporter TrkA [Clostridia bacterium]
MQIIVVGCGKIGTTIIASLVAEGHDVTAIDSRSEALEEVTNIYDVIGIQGNGGDCETLASAGVDKTELVVAVTGSDELNMLSCYIARQMGAAHTIARIRSPEYNDSSLEPMKQHLRLSTSINPERLAAEELYHILRLPSAVKIETFSHRKFEMIELILRPESPLVGAPLSQLRSRYQAKFLICVVQRGDEVFIPDGNFVLQGGDKIGITAAYTEFHKLMREVGIAQKQARHVMILGGSRTGYYLAKRLLNAGVSVKIIEQDRALCEELCDLLPKATVINGDGAQQELLLEEGLEDMDAFVSLTGMDEENILLSFFAASHNVPKVISKVSRDELGTLAQKLGLECIVSPRKIIANVLVRYARALENSLGSNVENLYKLMDDGAEALEFNVKDNPRLVRIPLRTLQLKPQVLIAGILRGREAIIPSGEDMILPGDRVVVIAAAGHFRDLADIIK